LLIVLCSIVMMRFLLFFLCDAANPEIYPPSLHDALPIWARVFVIATSIGVAPRSIAVSIIGAGLSELDWQAGDNVWITVIAVLRSEEHTSELQSRENLVCRLLLEKKHSQAFAGGGIQSLA